MKTRAIYCSDSIMMIGSVATAQYPQGLLRIFSVDWAQCRLDPCHTDDNPYENILSNRQSFVPGSAVINQNLIAASFSASAFSRCASLVFRAQLDAHYVTLLCCTRERPRARERRLMFGFNSISEIAAALGGRQPGPVSAVFCP